MSDFDRVVGQTYTYRVNAFNPFGISAYSNEVTATGTVNALKITGFTPQQGSPGSMVDISGMHLQMADGVLFNGVSAQIVLQQSNLLLVIVPMLPSPLQVSIQVKSPNGTDTSAAFFTVTAPPSSMAPNAPSGLTLTLLNGNQARLQWVDSSNNETGFVLERRVGSGAHMLLASLGANVTSYTDTGLQAGVFYGYRVQAVNSAGRSAYSPETTVVINAASAPPPVTTSISPTSGAPGTAVTIRGFSLISPLTVRFGGANGLIASSAFNADGSVMAIVPNGT